MTLLADEFIRHMQNEVFIRNTKLRTLKKLSVAEFGFGSKDMLDLIPNADPELYFESKTD